MNERRVRALQFAAVQVVGAVAVVHFAVGTEQLAGIVANGLLAEYLTNRVFERPRAALFLVSSVATLGGIVAAGRGTIKRGQAYRLGIGMLVTYLFGWLAWHTVLDHGFVLGGGGAVAETHSHGGLVETFLSHYVEPLAVTVSASTSGAPGTARTLLGVVSVTLELVGIALLTILLRVDPVAEPVDWRAWLTVQRGDEGGQR